MSFKMKGHTLPGFKQRKQGNMVTVPTVKSHSIPMEHLNNIDGSDTAWFNEDERDAVNNGLPEQPDINDTTVDKGGVPTVWNLARKAEVGGPLAGSEGEGNSMLSTLDIGGKIVAVDSSPGLVAESNNSTREEEVADQYTNNWSGGRRTGADHAKINDPEGWKRAQEESKMDWETLPNAVKDKRRDEKFSEILKIAKGNK